MDTQHEPVQYTSVASFYIFAANGIRGPHLHHGIFLRLVCYKTLIERTIKKMQNKCINFNLHI